ELIAAFKIEGIKTKIVDISTLIPEIAATNYTDGDPKPIDHVVVSGVYVVDRGVVLRSEGMGYRLSVLRRKRNLRLLAGDDLCRDRLFRQMNLRFLQEIVQREYPGDRWRQRRRDLRIVGVGPVFFAVHQVLVNRGVERFLHLTGGSRELKDGASFRRSDLESVGLQP